MKLNSNTVLITGGSSGIGFHLSKVLLQKGNTVIICGKSADKLLAAQQQEPKLITYLCDLSDSDECATFAKWLIQNHPSLNMLVNNAAIVNRINYLKDEDALTLAESEFQTNFFGPLRLIKFLYPTISKNESPVIVNITTGLIYAPRAIYPFYNSTKSALHSFTQVLRMDLQEEKTRVIEVMFPVVNTPWHKGAPPKIAISVEAAVNEMIKGLEKGKSEMRIGGAKLLYLISRIAPAFALKKINQVR